MNVNRRQALDAFAACVDAYDTGDPKVRLKIDHTYRVASLCERIARSVELDGRDVDLAWLCGILHDVGRFEQIRRHGTFNDVASESHAALGVQTLFDEGHIRDYCADASEDDLLRTVVATHSSYRLPEGLDERTHTFCDILRDADKIDILEVNCINTPEEIYDVTDEEMRRSPLSPAVVEAFYEHRTIPRGIKHFPADLVVGHICFVYELVYPESLRIARRQGYVFRMLDLPFENVETLAAFAAMRTHLEGWLEAREK